MNCYCFFVSSFAVVFVYAFFSHYIGRCVVPFSHHLSIYDIFFVETSGYITILILWSHFVLTKAANIYDLPVCIANIEIVVSFLTHTAATTYAGIIVMNSISL